MMGDDDDILAGHARSQHNRPDIEASDRCGCFSCLKTFRPRGIVAWISGGRGKADTARCPECGMDAVIGSAGGLPISDDFLRRMRQHWYRH